MENDYGSFYGANLWWFCISFLVQQEVLNPLRVITLFEQIPDQVSEKVIVIWFW